MDTACVSILQFSSLLVFPDGVSVLQMLCRLILGKTQAQRWILGAIPLHSNAEPAGWSQKPVPIGMSSKCTLKTEATVQDLLAEGALERPQIHLRNEKNPNTYLTHKMSEWVLPHVKGLK